jgi:hypothetical protein
MKPAVTLTIITTPIVEPDSFFSMYIEERRERSGGWDEFPLRSRLYVDSFLMQATDSHLGVFCEEHDHDSVKNGAGDMVTCFIDRSTLRRSLPLIARLVEKNAAKTALALFEHGQKKGDLARIEKTLSTGVWPKSGNPAEEAAAFGHQLLKYGRIAKGDNMGVCWEYRGPVEKRGG